MSLLMTNLQNDRRELFRIPAPPCLPQASRGAPQEPTLGAQMRPSQFPSYLLIRQGGHPLLVSLPAHRILPQDHDVLVL